MRLPRVRFTVGRLMVGIATLAVSWCMCLGIGHLTIYRSNVAGETYDRETAVSYELENNSDLAAPWRRMSEEYAWRNQESRIHILTALSLTSLGLAAGGITLAIRSRFGPSVKVRRGLAYRLDAACSTIAAIVLIGLAIGGVAYMGGMLLVLVTLD